MVIGIEGNVHVGKTTYIKKYYDNFNIIPESIFNATLNDFDRQLFYIEQELDKKKMVKSNTILDRTIISVIIYTLYSNKLADYEKENLLGIIKEKIKNNEIIIPTKIKVLLYPYKLICLNHMNLSKEKGTQNTLVDYNYYIKYTTYFTKHFISYERINDTYEYRQILLYSNKIFDSIDDTVNDGSKVLLDGINIISNKSIKKQILSLKQENVILYNSFLNKIFHLFYDNHTSKNKKIKIIDDIMKEVPLNYYVTNIIYVSNKKNDLEINFYKVIDKRLGYMSNIHFIQTLDEDTVKNIDDKILLLIDLFYEIKEGIKEGEL